LYVCVVLGIKPRALNMLGKQLYLWAVPLAQAYEVLACLDF
jgi:hypothetical protein